MQGNKVRIYDLEERNYPNQRGDSFRSLQVFECWVCGALTNWVIMGGSPGYGVRTVCQQSSLEWHHELEDKISLLQKPHPKSYKQELEKEISQLREKHEKEIKNNLVGDYDLNQKRLMTNVRSYKNR